MRNIGSMPGKKMTKSGSPTFILFYVCCSKSEKIKAVLITITLWHPYFKNFVEKFPYFKTLPIASAFNEI